MHFRKILTRVAVLTNNRGLLLLRRHENSRETNQARARKRNSQDWALRNLRGRIATPVAHRRGKSKTEDRTLRERKRIQVELLQAGALRDI